MDYLIRTYHNPMDIPASEWDNLLNSQDVPTPFMRHAYLSALHRNGCATAQTGWTPLFVTLWKNNTLMGASPLYIKTHSYGEYVFDWAWANAYAHHGLNYFPKASAAIPFTPVPGSRLLAVDSHARQSLLQTMLDIVQQQGLSSLHLLFTSPDDRVACTAAGLLQRQTVQFHWHNTTPQGKRFASFDTFLTTLSQDKRKKIKQERRQVAEAGVTFRTVVGTQISGEEWDFFYRCYERTYLEHGNPPYLNRAFFQDMQVHMPHHWVLFIAERHGQPIACSLIAIEQNAAGNVVAYGRYWGALERVNCLHFEACYYQPILWCIQEGVQRFEGGAQGEHKMARALMPCQTYSAHWLAHPAFSNAVADFLTRESAGIDQYLQHLAQRSPFKSSN